MPLARRFTFAYGVALALFGLVGIYATTSSGNSLDELAAIDRRAELSTEQLGRVHRIVELAREMDAAGAIDDLRGIQEASSGLRQEAKALRQAQQELLDRTDEGQDQVRVMSPALEELYFGSGLLDRRLSNYASTAELVANFNRPDEADNRAGPLQELEEQEGRLITDLEGAVMLYAKESSAVVQRQRDSNLVVLALGAGVAVVTVMLLFRPMARTIASETTRLETAERLQRENSMRQTFRNELTNALEVCHEESEVLDAAARAFSEIVPDDPAELLMLDPLRTHVQAAVTNPAAGPAGCPVDSPQGCAALRAGQPMVYESSRMLNVCPKLPLHATAPCSALCVPLVFNGEAVGVLHAVGAENEPFSSTVSERLKVLARETGTRLGTLRITKATERLAARDVLTDLDNRRTLLVKATALMEEARPFSLAVADLDHFKDLNDTYGHETGDRALQLFSDCLRTHLRPEDIVARWGGEEFVVVLPDTTVSAATVAIDRLQVALAEEIESRSSVPFTASWGLTDSHSGDSFQSMLNAADLAMYEAKRAGRNRLVVDPSAVLRSAAEGPDDPAGTPATSTADEPTG